MEWHSLHSEICTKMTALGRRFRLGAVYDYRDDLILSGIVWYFQNPKAFVPIVPIFLFIVTQHKINKIYL